MPYKAQTGSRGIFSPSPHTTRRAGPHRAVPRACRAEAGQSVTTYGSLTNCKGSPGSSNTMSRRRITHPVGLIVSDERHESPLPALSSALHHVFPIRGSVGLLWPRLTSARSPQGLLQEALPGCAVGSCGISGPFDPDLSQAPDGTPGCPSSRSPRIRT
jgi:hypothetical protein